MDTGKASSIQLPKPSLKSDVSLEVSITRRRSIRNFTPQPISLSQLSQILWAAQGITGKNRNYRSVPSAGATFPLEIFVVCGNNGLERIEAGLYHYDINNHSLASHSKGDRRLQLSKAALNQSQIYKAPVSIVICAQYERTTMSYGNRGERYVHMEVGHSGQNIHLQAVALGLATVVIGAFHDEQVQQVLQLDKKYKPLYIMPIGNPA